MQTAADVAEPLDQLPLDERVHVLVWAIDEGRLTFVERKLVEREHVPGDAEPFHQGGAEPLILREKPCPSAQSVRRRRVRVLREVLR